MQRFAQNYTELFSLYVITPHALPVNVYVHRAQAAECVAWLQGNPLTTALYVIASVIVSVCLFIYYYLAYTHF